jgi:hypothetical protein
LGIIAVAHYNIPKKEDKGWHDVTITEPHRSGVAVTFTTPNHANEKENHSIKQNSADWDPISSTLLRASTDTSNSISDTDIIDIYSIKARNQETRASVLPSVRQGVVLYAFEPENPGELAVEADDIIEVIEVKGEWIECITEDNRHGWVPFNYVQIQQDNSS